MVDVYGMLSDTESRVIFAWCEMPPIKLYRMETEMKAAVDGFKFGMIARKDAKAVETV